MTFVTFPFILRILDVGWNRIRHIFGESWQLSLSCLWTNNNEHIYKTNNNKIIIIRLTGKFVFKRKWKQKRKKEVWLTRKGWVFIIARFEFCWLDELSWVTFGFENVVSFYIFQNLIWNYKIQTDVTLRQINNKKYEYGEVGEEYLKE